MRGVQGENAGNSSVSSLRFFKTSPMRGALRLRIFSCSLKPPAGESSTPPRRYWQRSKYRSAETGCVRPPRRQSAGGNDEAGLKRRTDTQTDHRHCAGTYAVARQIRQQRGTCRINRSRTLCWRVRRSAWVSYRRRRHGSCPLQTQSARHIWFSLRLNLSEAMPKGSCSRACVIL